MVQISSCSSCVPVEVNHSVHYSNLKFFVNKIFYGFFKFFFLLLLIFLMYKMIFGWPGDLVSLYAVKSQVFPCSSVFLL